MPTEAEDAGCEAVPADLVELHEVLEWEAAVRERDDAEIARGVTGSARAPEADPPESENPDRWEADADRQIPDDEDDGPDVSDTQTGQGVE
jgi:hypothetical protein